MALPTGNEKGIFLTMDMGGTNFRVCKVELLGSGKYNTTQMDTKIPGAIKSGTAQQLWLFIIQCLRKFVDYHKIPSDELQKIPLAFTFSYPVTQTSVTNGVLQTWTKGFDISGVEGHDVTTELQRALYENVSLSPTSLEALLTHVFARTCHYR
jgi:hexokinase